MMKNKIGFFDLNVGNVIKIRKGQSSISFVNNRNKKEAKYFYVNEILTIVNLTPPENSFFDGKVRMMTILHENGLWDRIIKESTFSKIFEVVI